jgi:hypothetical protein
MLKVLGWREVRGLIIVTGFGSPDEEALAKSLANEMDLEFVSGNTLRAAHATFDDFCTAVTDAVRDGTEMVYVSSFTDPRDTDNGRSVMLRKLLLFADKVICCNGPEAVQSALASYKAYAAANYSYVKWEDRTV